jgi:hypothetical protein
MAGDARIKCRGMPVVRWITIDAGSPRAAKFSDECGVAGIRERMLLATRGNYDNMDLSRCGNIALSPGELGCMSSHLRCVWDFHNSPDEDMCVIMEDDCDLMGSLLHWRGFSWPDVMASLPTGWTFVSMHHYPLNVSRIPAFYSGGSYKDRPGNLPAVLPGMSAGYTGLAYIINKGFSGRMVEAFGVGRDGVWHVPSRDLPAVDVMYGRSGIPGMHTLPIFFEDESLDSSLTPNVLYLRARRAGRRSIKDAMDHPGRYRIPALNYAGVAVHSVGEFAFEIAVAAATLGATMITLKMLY